MQRFEKAWEVKAEGHGKGSREDQGWLQEESSRKQQMAFGWCAGRGTSEEITLFDSCCMQKNGNFIIQLCYAGLSCQSQKYKAGGWRSCESDSSRPLDGSTEPYQPFFSWDGKPCYRGKEAHPFPSALWTTTVLTQLLLEGISKGHLVPLGCRIIYGYIISYRIFSLKICSEVDCMQ